MGFPPSSVGGVLSTNGKLNAKWNLRVPQLHFINMGGIEAAIDTGNSNCIFDPNCYGSSGIGDTYKDTAPGVAPTTCAVNNSVNLSAAKTTGTLKIGEVGEMLLTKSNAASALGEQYAIPFSILPYQQYKVNHISFDYYTSANYADGFFRVYIYDATNGAYLGELSERDLLANANGTYSGSFQATSSSDYYLVLHCTDSSSANWTANIGNFFVGRKPVIKGAIVTDWVSFTPTGSWSTNTTYTGQKRRVGDVAEYRVRVALAGAPTSAALTINIPDGQIDTTKVPQAASSSEWYGYGAYRDSGTATYPVKVDYSSATAVAVFYADDAAAGVTSAALTQAAPVTMASGDSIYVYFSVPIAGWSSNLVLSEDTGNRVIAANVGLSGNQAIASASEKQVLFDSVTSDSTGSFASNVYTIPESGYYHISAGLQLSSVTAGEVCSMIVRISGVGVIFSNSGFAASGGGTYLSASKTAYFTKGQGILVNTDSAADTSYQVDAGSRTFFSIHKVQTPQSIASTEFVGASYISDTGGDTANQGDILINATKNFDSHNAYSTSTGIFTVPASGKYLVTVGARSQAVVGAVANIWGIDLQKNSTDLIRIAQHLVQSTTSSSMACAGSVVVDCVRGDTLRLEFNDNISNSISLSTGAGDSYCSFVRVG